MPSTLTIIDPRDAAAASAGHPLIVHVAAYPADGLPAWQYADAVAVAYHYWEHPDLVAVGPPEDVAALAVELGDDVAHWISVPTAAAGLLPDGFLLDTHDWVFRWIDRPTGTDPAAARWLGADETEDVRRLLAAGFADASVTPDSPRARRWAGVRDDDGSLVACAVDSTGPGGVGFVASITVDPQARGRGLGRRVTGWTLDRLVEEHGRAALWAHCGNAPAIAVYDRLGMVAEPMTAGALPAAHRYVEG